MPGKQDVYPAQQPQLSGRRIPVLLAQSQMLIDQRADSLVVWAPAKINLFLEVLRKRADGYHELETLMVAVSLFDTLEFREDSSNRIRLDCTNPNLSAAADNLVVRAALLLRERTGCNRGAAIQLSKRIPLAAGLAGGSSDAAATLVALNQLWQTGLSNEELAVLGSELGSDIAFFFHGSAGWCTGKGEIVTPISVKRRLWFVLLCPPVGLPTKDVFQRVRVPEEPRKGVNICAALERGTFEDIVKNLHNRLQPAAEDLYPPLADQRQLLERSCPVGTLMTGSGSSLFSLCNDAASAKSLADKVRRNTALIPGTEVYIVRSLSPSRGVSFLKA